MPITMMIGRENAFDAEGKLKPNVKIVRDYHGHEEGVRHGKTCAHYGKVRDGVDKALTAECVASKWYSLPDDPATNSYGRGYSAVINPLTGEFVLDGEGKPVRSPLSYSGDGCIVVEPLYMETTHVGIVIDADGERNGRDDSDFYATVWNGTHPVEVTFATTRGWTYPNHAEADATPEVLAAYEAYLAARREAASKAFEERMEEEARKAALLPKVGAPCRVVKGRKVPVGTTGTCTWKGAGNFGEQVKIETASGEVHWTAVGNVERVVAKPDDMSWRDFVAAEYRATPKKGDKLRVVAGSDAPVGTEGPCVWTDNKRVGVATSTRRVKGRYADVVWTDIKNVEVVHAG